MDPPVQPSETLTAQMVAGVTTPVDDDHDDRFNVPSLDELGNIIICLCLILSHQWL